MSFLWISAFKDVRRHLTDPIALLLWLGVPLLIGSLMGLVMGGGGSGLTPRAKLLWVDQDDSLVTNLIASAASGGEADAMIELIPLELEEARERIDAGDASAMLVIPEGFGQALLQEEAIQLTLLTNPAQRILPGILEEGLQMLVEAAFYLQRLLGEELASLAEAPPGDSTFFSSAKIAAQAASINDRMQSLEGVLFPPLLDFEIEVLEREGEVTQNLSLLLFPGILFLAILFIAQGISSDLWKERKSGTLQRALCTPHGLSFFLFGKYMAGALVIAGVTAVGLAVGATLFELPLAGLLPALLWGTFSGLILLPLFMWVQVLASSEQAGNLTSTMLLFPMMMIGGSLFPFEAMPDWMVAVGQWTPNGMAMLEFKALLVGSAEPASLARSFGILAALGAVLFLLTIRRAGGSFLQA